MSSAMQPQQPSADAKLAHVSNRQVARIGLVAGVLAALVTVPATLIAADWARDAAVANTTAQVNGETAKSRAEFLRPRQQVAYASILNDHEALRELEDEKYGQQRTAQAPGDRGLLVVEPATKSERAMIRTCGWPSAG